MKKRQMIFLFCIIGILSLTVLLWAADMLAVVLKVKGSVSVYKSGKNDSENAARGFRLQAGDKLVTGEKSFTALRFVDDASLVRIGANSVCLINGKKEGSSILKNIFLETGTILSEITRQKGSFQVATPTSVASVKGTRYVAHHDNRLGTFYYGEDGLIFIYNDSDSTTIGPGQTAHVKSNTSIIIVSLTGPGDVPLIDRESVDNVEIDFEDASGKKKTLQFKVNQ